MVQHGPKCLEGPIIGSRPWWQETGKPSSSNDSGLAKDRHRAERENAPIRFELVQRIRRQIADGTYDTPEKFEAALDEMFATLNLD